MFICINKDCIYLSKINCFYTDDIKYSYLIQIFLGISYRNESMHIEIVNINANLNEEDRKKYIKKQSKLTQKYTCNYFFLYSDGRKRFTIKD